MLSMLFAVHFAKESVKNRPYIRESCIFFQNLLIFSENVIQYELEQYYHRSGTHITYYSNQEVTAMAYVINDSCIQCGACADACPAGAISEGDGKYIIDADTCLDCGACADACPVGAPEQA